MSANDLANIDGRDLYSPSGDRLQGFGDVMRLLWAWIPYFKRHDVSRRGQCASRKHPTASVRAREYPLDGSALACPPAFLRAQEHARGATICSLADDLNGLPALRVDLETFGMIKLSRL